MVSGSKNAPMLDLELEGWLKIISSSSSSGTDSVSARFTGKAVLSNKTENESVKLNSISVNLKKALTIYGERIEIDANLSQVGDMTRVTAPIKLQAKWQIEPELIEISLEPSYEPNEPLLRLVALLERDDAVLAVGNPVRDMSENAIALLATQEKDPNFAADATANLFGNPPAEDGTLKVLAREDWVLFHRRRDKQCGIDQPQPKKETFCHDIYLVDDETAVQLASTASQQQKLDSYFKQLKPWMTVEFEQDQSTLTNDSINRLKKAWATSNQVNYRFGFFDSTEPSLENITQKQSSAIVNTLEDDKSPLDAVIGVNNISEFSSCNSLTLLGLQEMDILMIGSFKPQNYGNQVTKDSPKAVGKLVNFQPMQSGVFTSMLEDFMERLNTFFSNQNRNDNQSINVDVTVKSKNQLSDAEKIKTLIQTEFQDLNNVDKRVIYSEEHTNLTNNAEENPDEYYTIVFFWK